MISDQDVARYRDEGCILVENVFDREQLASVRSVIDGILASAKGKLTHDDVYDFEPSHTPDDPRVRRIKKPHVVNKLFWELVQTPRMLAILTKLLGPNVRLHGSKLNIKAPRYGSPVEWHQDWAFYPHTNDDILAIGVMLDDTTVENGAMMVIPGTHKGPTYDHHDREGSFCGAMDPDTCGIDFSKAVACEGEAGSCSFHHVRLVHGSAQNTSLKPRGLLLYEVAAGDAYPLMGAGNFADFQSRLLFGEHTIVPRFREAPVRMPLPPAKNQGSIYENQTAGKRFFGFTEPSAKVG